MQIEDTTSSRMMQLLLWFKRGNGKLPADEARTFEALLKECIAEVELMEVGTPAQPGVVKFTANENRTRQKGGAA